jgi:uncharacterized membrane protein HdeD (DUF308 family)
MNASALRVVLGIVIGALPGLALGLAFGRIALTVALGAAAAAMLNGVFELAKKHSAHDKAGVGTVFGVVGVVAGSILDPSGSR